MMQINLTGFLGGNKARLFVSELWDLLSSAQNSKDGIPAALVEMKKNELIRKQVRFDEISFDLVCRTFLFSKKKNDWEKFDDAKKKHID